MIFDDNRAFVEALRQSGDLVEVEKEVSWDLELGAVSRLACEKDGPAVWFKRVTDYVDEVSVFVNPVATWRRIAIALGLPATATVREIYDAYEKGEAN
ncbi:MAG: UbiD family decarboxylase, partial [Deltaproteobacteria bacterium]|nr:UbiD family decarboxylase [Deltaproteobacteria bacterium]